MATSNQDDDRGNRGGNQGGNQGNNQQGGNQSSNRGFASMDPDRQREIASEGGRAAHASGNAHEFTSEEAREAGQKSHGGQGGGQGGQASGGGRDDSGGGRGSNQSGNQGSSGGTRGGTSEQHAEAGRQSHKNDR